LDELKVDLWLKMLAQANLLLHQEGLNAFSFSLLGLSVFYMLYSSVYLPKM